MNRLNAVRWALLIVAAAIFGSFAGYILAKLVASATPDYLSAISSLGSLGAAIAAFLTLREMRAARRLSARARVGLQGASQPTRFIWTLSTNNLELPDGAPSVTLRNSTQGSANSVVAVWTASTKIVADDIASINKLLSGQNRAELGPSTYEIILSGKDVISLPIAGMDRSVVGDIGPAQDHEISVPAVILDYAVVKWMALFDRMLRKDALGVGEIPRFKLEFSHSNPYEKRVLDEHEMRFVMLRFLVFDADGKELKMLDWLRANRIEATIAPEIWKADELQPATVLVGETSGL